MLNVATYNSLYPRTIYPLNRTVYHGTMAGMIVAGHNLPDKCCVADTAMQIELA